LWPEWREIDVSAVLAVLAFSPSLFRAGIELIHSAKSANATDRRPALFERDESAIGSSPRRINGAPSIGIGVCRRSKETDRECGNGGKT
jgi:hypothetical protein